MGCKKFIKTHTIVKKDIINLILQFVVDFISCPFMQSKNNVMMWKKNMNLIFIKDLLLLQQIFIGQASQSLRPLSKETKFISLQSTYFNGRILHSKQHCSRKLSKILCSNWKESISVIIINLW